MANGEKPLFWIASSKDDLDDFPPDVQDVMGYALDLAQHGKKHPGAKPLKGHKGAGVLEVVDDYDGDTYRAVYTVRFEGAVYVLHAFQKKAKKGIATPKAELRKIEARLRRAEQEHAEWMKEKDRNGQDGSNPQ